MGVNGLWQLLQPLGYPVALDSLENKVLAVDVSIWLNQAIKGFRDHEGKSLKNSHLLGLFHRICKLLFYRIKPVFVFDGGVPILKKQTLACRRQRKEIAAKESHQTSKRLLLNILNRQAIKDTLKGEGKVNSVSTSEEVCIVKPNVPDIFELPPLPQKNEELSQETLEGNESSDDDYNEVFGFQERFQDLSNIDINSEEFKLLPPDIQHEILSEMKDIQKHNSWANLEEMPKESRCFSDFQLTRLLNRRSLQKCLEDVRDKLNSNASQDIAAEYFGNNFSINMNAESRRIVSEDATHYILIKNKSITTPSTSSADKNLLDSISSTSKIVDSSDCIDKIMKKERSLSFNCIDLTKEKSEQKLKTDEQKNEIYLLDKDMKFKSESSLSDDELLKMETRDSLADSDQLNTKLSSVLHSSEQKDVDLLKQPIKQENLNQELNRQSHSLSEQKPSLETVHYIELEKTNTNLDTLKTEDIKKESLVDEINIKSKDSSFIKMTDDFKKFDESSTSDDSFEEVPEIDVEEYSRSFSNQRKETIIDTSTSDEPERGFKEVIPEISQLENKVLAFVNEIAEATPEASINVELLEKLDSDLQAEQQALIKEKSTQERIAVSVTDQMYIETQELLRLFGIPFVVSPMEAEAQCAILEQLKLTEGTITDDSDIWLFGGHHVYKNFFNQKKSIELYKNSDILKELGLDRLKLICIALMTGSDYTDGIEGVGYVTALEIISEFGGENMESLRKFKNWWCESQKQCKYPHETKIKQKLRQLTVHEGFPNVAVVDAYLNPAVDHSDEKFSWQMPDLDALREFTYSKFGWTKEKADGIILPVIKKLNLTKSQTRIDSYFQHSVDNRILQPSKRVKRALKKLRPTAVEEKEEPKKKAACTYLKSRRKKELPKSINISESSSEEDNE